ncbi:MAG: PilN domain-containing protein [Candidatus Omnitrophota bacterium]
MDKKLKVHKHKNAVFICQISDSYIKVLKCLVGKTSARKFIGLEIEKLPADTNDKNLLDIFNRVFNKLGYINNPIIVSLPCAQATCRYLSVPSQDLREIGKIVSLQASRYLPYQPSELITGFDLISAEKDGSSYINQIILNKSNIENYIRALKGLKPSKFNVVLSSYGICNLYNYICKKEPYTTVIVDLDSTQVELAFIKNSKLLFSRSFNLLRDKEGWQNPFVAEIGISLEAFLRGISKERPVKIVMFDKTKEVGEFVEILKKHISLPVEVLSYTDKLNIDSKLIEKVSGTDISFNSLIGLGLKDIDENLNLLTKDLKEKAGRNIELRERLFSGILITAVFLILGLAIVKDLNNRAVYLNMIKIELNKVSKEAKNLENIDKRLKLLENRSENKQVILNMLSELNKVMPAEITLSSFSYEEDKQVVLRGQAKELNFIFKFVSQLERIPVFKVFNVKVRYATKKKFAAGEVIDFEIIGLK